MKTPIFSGFVALSIASLLLMTGCGQTVQLSENDKELVKIQEEAGAKVEELSQKIGENGNYEETQKLAEEVSGWIQLQVQRMNKFQSDIESSKVFQETKSILESGQRLTAKVEELTEELKTLSSQVGTLTDEAKKVAQEKIDAMKKSIDGFKTRLSDLNDKFNDLKNDLFEANKQ